jgi:hypothetical protein
MRFILPAIFAASLLFACKGNHEKKEATDTTSNTRDLTFFLHRLRTLDYMPELEASHTALASTWDTNGLNNDGNCFKDIRDTVNILLDKDGPGCIHRIFTGQPYFQTHDTRFQVFIDGSIKPVFDVPLCDLFDPARSPFPYPLCSNKTYPGILFPIPYKNHIKVQLYNPLAENWGNYWQVTYTTYPANIAVKSLAYPFSDAENGEIQKVISEWLEAERNQPAMPEKWPFKQKLSIKAGESSEITLNGTGIIRQLYITASPNTPDTWRNTRFTVYWDATGKKSIDVPLGYFFGNADYASMFQYNSMITGITAEGAYSMFPMPYEKGAKMVFLNQNKEDIVLEVNLNIEETKSLQPGVGRFHATFTEVEPYGKNYDSLPRFGKSPKPFHITLQTNSGPGKYVGTLVHVAWPHKDIWWGEGDWLIWTDEEGFPPSYHGTGSEEYFNSGWCYFDRKAISGYIKMRPGNVNVYSYHLNDAFQFTHKIKVAVEIWWWPQEIMKSIYGSTAFWYANPPQDAGSDQDLAYPRLIHHGKIKGENGVWEDEN